MDGQTAFERLLSMVEKYQLPMVLGLLGVILIGVGFLLPKLSSSSPKQEIAVQDSKQNPSSANKIMVDIAGAVKKPGVYSLVQEARLADALEAAGGFNDQVDNAWVSKNLNLASKVTDSQKIYVASLGEDVPLAVSAGSVAGVLTTGTVNINVASESQLDTLPGIGEVTAVKIIAGRPYSKIEDLLNRKIVGKSTYEKIKDKISVY